MRHISNGAFRMEGIHEMSVSLGSVTPHALDEPYQNPLEGVKSRAQGSVSPRKTFNPNGTLQRVAHFLCNNQHNVSSPRDVFEIALAVESTRVT